MTLENFTTAQLNEFVRLLTSNQRMIYAHILSLVANFSDADDVMQDTSQYLWEKFGGYRPGSDFLAWARTVAYYRVMEYRRRKSRDGVVIFDDRLIETIEQENGSDTDTHVTDHYLAMLRECMKKVGGVDLELIQLKYFQNITPREISDRVGRKTQSVYRSLARIQSQLLECIKQRRLAEEQA